jgi:hypothetical protein
MLNTAGLAKKALEVKQRSILQRQQAATTQQVRTLASQVCA